MAINTFIPALWSARLLDHLDKNLVLGNLVNRDYEGEIKKPTVPPPNWSLTRPTTSASRSTTWTLPRPTSI